MHGSHAGLTVWKGKRLAEAISGSNIFGRGARHFERGNFLKRQVKLLQVYTNSQLDLTNFYLILSLQH